MHDARRCRRLGANLEFAFAAKRVTLAPRWLRLEESRLRQGSGMASAMLAYYGSDTAIRFRRRRHGHEEERAEERHPTPGADCVQALIGEHSAWRLAASRSW